MVGRRDRWVAGRGHDERGSRRAPRARERSGAEVRITRADGTLVLAVADDGVGGVDPLRGTGPRGLGDRVESLRGTFRVSDRATGGTLVTAALPLR